MGRERVGDVWGQGYVRGTLLAPLSALHFLRGVEGELVGRDRGWAMPGGARNRSHSGHTAGSHFPPRKEDRGEKTNSSRLWAQKSVCQPFQMEVGFF